MRDPAVRVDPEVEAAIEDARRFLEPFVRGKDWKADLEPQHTRIEMALEHIRRKSPRWVFRAVCEPLMQAAQKRTKKPTLFGRHILIAAAAVRLMPKYKPSRNEATRDVESASSIVCRALRRLDITMEEKTIREIVSKHQKNARFYLSDQREFYAGMPR